MRNLNANALAKIAQTKGTEPVIIVDVNWSGPNFEQYADKDVGTIPGKIIEVSNLDAVVNIDNSSDTQEIVIKLDDIDGTLKATIDMNDIHKREVKVYQWFEGLQLTDRFLLFSGKINSPIVWSEGDRTLSFSVVSNLEDNEIGYSAEEGLFNNMPESVIGQAWPMCFGTVTFAKALRLTTRVKGVLADGLSWKDFGLVHRSAVLRSIKQIIIDKISSGLCENAYRSTAWDQGRICQNTIEQATQQYTDQISAISSTLAQQPDLNMHPRIINGENFPQGNPMYLRIGGVTYYGKFTDNVFSFIINPTLLGASNATPGSGSQHPNIGDFSYSSYIKTARELYDGRKHSGKRIPRKGITTWKQWILDRWLSGYYYNGQVEGDNAGYVYVEPGATVSISEAEPQTYVVSITPGTVQRVSAWAEKEGQRFLQDVDPSFYRVYTEQYGDLTVTFLELKDALSKNTTYDWSDDVYVIFKSDIGPNTVDILQYIIETYSDYTVDAASFAAVRTKVANYPMNFAIQDRPELFTVLQEIAWQARCAIWLKNGVFFINYLSEEPTPVDTITESEIHLNSLVLAHTPTEDLVTKMVCEWRESELQEEPYTTILRHNVAKYGTHEQSYDFYAYNYEDAVIKSATFWLIRYANTWKQLKFNVPLTLLNIETFDPVTLDFSSNYVANVDVIAMIESAIYDSSNNSIEIMCWCPVRSGEMTPYYFAYPAQVDSVATFPTTWEIQHGYDGGNSPGRDNVRRVGFKNDGGDTEILPPITLDLKSNIGDPFNLKYGTTGDRKIEDKGNPTPSDIGDSAPGPVTIRPAEAFGPNAPGAPSIAPTGAPFDEKVGDTQPYDTGGEAGAPGIGGEVGPEGFDPNNLPPASAVPENPCNSTVTVYWFDVHLVTRLCDRTFTVDEVNAGLGYQSGTQGKPAFGPALTPPEVIVFNTCAKATAYRDMMIAYANTCGAVVGKAFVSSALLNCGLGCVEPLPSNNEDGMLGYTPSPGQTPYSEGVGPWRKSQGL
jgi:hypothetical protein